MAGKDEVSEEWQIIIGVDATIAEQTAEHAHLLSSHEDQSLCSNAHGYKTESTQMHAWNSSSKVGGDKKLIGALLASSSGEIQEKTLPQMNRGRVTENTQQNSLFWSAHMHRYMYPVPYTCAYRLIQTYTHACIHR